MPLTYVILTFGLDPPLRGSDVRHPESVGDSASRESSCKHRAHSPSRMEDSLRCVNQVEFIARRGVRHTNETLEHDGPKRPPITFLAISLLQENLGRNLATISTDVSQRKTYVVRRPDRRIC